MCFFKEGIHPSWEDQFNLNGSSIQYDYKNIDNEAIDNIWRKMMVDLYSNEIFAHSIVFLYFLYYHSSMESGFSRNSVLEGGSRSSSGTIKISETMTNFISNSLKKTLIIWILCIKLTGSKLSSIYITKPKTRLKKLKKKAKEFKEMIITINDFINTDFNKLINF